MPDDSKVMSSADIEDTHSVKMGEVSSANVDVAAAYAHHLTGENAYTRKEATRLRWKLDLRLVPLLWFNITLGAMDKVTTATAALYGFRADTGLTGDRYSWVGSAFYFGYLFWCLPSGSLLQRFPIAKLMFVVQLLWGCILIATGFANNFPTLIALRVLLGALEAPIVPGNFLIISMWYPRREQPLRTGLMYTGLSVCFTGPIGYGIGFLAGEHQWRAMFWITGAMTIVWACVIGIFLPDNPVKAKFVSERQKAIVIDKIRQDQTGVENKTFKKDQMIEAFLDPKTWLMFFFHIWISIPNGGLTNFTPLIIKGLGYTSQRSTLLTMPTGILQTVASYVCNGGVFLTAKYFPAKQLRTAWVVFGIIVGMISAVFLYVLPIDNYNGRLAALYCSYFYLGPYIVALGINTANTAGHTKKVTVNALVFIAYCISNIIAPQFFKADQAPLYPLDEQKAFEANVAAIEKQWSSARQSHLKRPYTASTIAVLRTSIPASSEASSIQAIKLWKQLNAHNKAGTCELTFGTTDPVAVSQMAKHQQTVYVSGALCGFSEVALPGMDHADYPWDTVPKVVSKIFKSQLWHDQRQRQYRLRHPIEEREELENWDYMAPIVADGDMGFGSLTSTMKMAREFVDAGVAMIHIDDLAIGMKKFTIGQGRTIVPTQEYLDRLTAVRMQFDVMGAETLLLCRCDTDHAEFITSVVDERDHEYVQGATKKIEPLQKCLAAAQMQGQDLKAARDEWKAKAGMKTFDEAVEAVASKEEFAAYKAELSKRQVASLSDRRDIANKTVKQEVFFDWELSRSAMGQYMIKSCVKGIVERAIAAAPLGDVTWARMDSPKWEDIVEFHTEVRKVYPDRLFAFGYTGDYDFAKAGFSDDQVKNLHLDLAKLGIVWQVQPIWSLQGLNMVTEQFAKMWQDQGIAGYLKSVQGPALSSKPMTDGFEKLSYCGGYLADAFFETVAGESIVEKGKSV
ncbi:hypothetical protein J4E90_003835 [Alternaria incomplexa]|uniref:uncharacterized protein n=1 Tax=Alternaria incomplexa TaxID=1187928 RepID=UPI00221F5718|nr:uncharacterized protein J4E90_003835 [Alternaria incomplexa]KAI4917328.1 hypothetical protein J4E90_003835 [Alternaria incomplexa]